MVACFNAVEQCSAINNLSIASALQVSKSGLCKLKTLCYIRLRAKSSLVLSECFCCQLCLLGSQLPSLHWMSHWAAWACMLSTIPASANPTSRGRLGIR